MLDIRHLYTARIDSDSNRTAMQLSGDPDLINQALSVVGTAIPRIETITIGDANRVRLVFSGRVDDAMAVFYRIAEAYYSLTRAAETEPS